MATRALNIMSISRMAPVNDFRFLFTCMQTSNSGFTSHNSLVYLLARIDNNFCLTSLCTSRVHREHGSDYGRELTSLEKSRGGS
ncbi:hypothetical protein ES702_03125 [subsurface metagenome]